MSGRPDLIAKYPDGRTVIYDAKTGRQSTSHLLQVQFYMYLLPRLPDSRWRGTRFWGAVVYPDGADDRIPPDSIDVAFTSGLRTSCRRWRQTCRLVAYRVPSSAASASLPAPTVRSGLSRSRSCRRMGVEFKPVEHHIHKRARAACATAGPRVMPTYRRGLVRAA